MKKLMSLSLACALALSLTACGAGTSQSTSSGSGDQEPAAQAVELVVFAAASMTETLETIAEQYKTVDPRSAYSC